MLHRLKILSFSKVDNKASTTGCEDFCDGSRANSIVDGPGPSKCSNFRSLRLSKTKRKSAPLSNDQPADETKSTRASVVLPPCRSQSVNIIRKVSENILKCLPQRKSRSYTNITTDGSQYCSNSYTTYPSVNRKSKRKCTAKNVEVIYVSKHMPTWKCSGDAHVPKLRPPKQTQYNTESTPHIASLQNKDTSYFPKRHRFDPYSFCNKYIKTEQTTPKLSKQKRIKPPSSIGKYSAYANHILKTGVSTCSRKIGNKVKKMKFHKPLDLVELPISEIRLKESVSRIGEVPANQVREESSYPMRKFHNAKHIIDKEVSRFRRKRHPRRSRSHSIKYVYNYEMGDVTPYRPTILRRSVSYSGTNSSALPSMPTTGSKSTPIILHNKKKEFKVPRIHKSHSRNHKIKKLNPNNKIKSKTKVNLLKSTAQNLFLLTCSPCFAVMFLSWILSQPLKTQRAAKSDEKKRRSKYKQRRKDNMNINRKNIHFDNIPEGSSVHAPNYTRHHNKYGRRHVRYSHVKDPRRRKSGRGQHTQSYYPHAKPHRVPYHTREYLTYSMFTGSFVDKIAARVGLWSSKINKHSKLSSSYITQVYSGYVNQCQNKGSCRSVRFSDPEFCIPEKSYSPGKCMAKKSVLKKKIAEPPCETCETISRSCRPICDHVNRKIGSCQPSQKTFGNTTDTICDTPPYETRSNSTQYLPPPFEFERVPENKHSMQQYEPQLSKSEPSSPQLSDPKQSSSQLSEAEQSSPQLSEPEQRDANRREIRQHKRKHHEKKQRETKKSKSQQRLPHQSEPNQRELLQREIHQFEPEQHNSDETVSKERHRVGTVSQTSLESEPQETEVGPKKSHHKKEKSKRSRHKEPQETEIGPKKSHHKKEKSKISRLIEPQETEVEPKKSHHKKEKSKVSRLVEPQETEVGPKTSYHKKEKSKRSRLIEPQETEVGPKKSHHRKEKSKVSRLIEPQETEVGPKTSYHKKQKSKISTLKSAGFKSKIKNEKSEIAVLVNIKDDKRKSVKDWIKDKFRKSHSEIRVVNKESVVSKRHEKSKSKKKSLVEINREDSPKPVTNNYKYKFGNKKRKMSGASDMNVFVGSVSGEENVKDVGTDPPPEIKSESSEAGAKKTKKKGKEKKPKKPKKEKKKKKKKKKVKLTAAQKRNFFQCFKSLFAGGPQHKGSGRCEDLYLYILKEKPFFDKVYKRWPGLYPEFLKVYTCFNICFSHVLICLTFFLWCPCLSFCYMVFKAICGVVCGCN